MKVLENDSPSPPYRTVRVQNFETSYGYSAANLVWFILLYQTVHAKIQHIDNGHDSRSAASPTEQVAEAGHHVRARSRLLDTIAARGIPSHELGTAGLAAGSEHSSATGRDCRDESSRT